jgi:hypothetical protein
MTADQIKAALREAFDAGCEQGGDEATAYEWGSLPNQNREKAFSDLFEDWNTGPIQDLLKTVK